MLGLLNHLSAFSSLLPLGTAGLRYPALDRVLRQLAWFFFVGGLFDLSEVITNYFALQNMPLIHIFAAVNLVFLGAFYAQTLPGRFLHLALWLAVGLGLGFTLYNVLLPGHMGQFPSRPVAAQCVLFIVLALYYFYHLLQQPAVLALEHQPLFWINAGVLTYFSGNLFLFMLQEQLNHHSGYWAIHSVLNILANLLYAFGLLCKPPPHP